MQIAVFDRDPSALGQMRERLLQYSIREDTDFEVLWFTGADSEQKLETYAQNIMIAFISLEHEEGGRIGAGLYRLNPDCRICYYRSLPCDLEPVLSSRPIGFCLWKQEESVFFKKLDEITQELQTARDVFCYHTRRLLFTIPFRSILYFQSDLKHVRIHTVNQKEESVCAKLSEIEEKLNQTFLRIHKSFIVNLYHVQYLDKKTRMLYLSNGEQLPVSEAQYEKTVKRFSTV